MWADLLIKCNGLSRVAAITPDKTSGWYVGSAAAALLVALRWFGLSHTHTQLTWCGDVPSRLSNQTFLISRILQAPLESTAFLLTSLQLDWKPTCSAGRLCTIFTARWRKQTFARLFETTQADMQEQINTNNECSSVLHHLSITQGTSRRIILLARPPTHQCERTSEGDKLLLVSVLLIS